MSHNMGVTIGVSHSLDFVEGHGVCDGLGLVQVAVRDIEGAGRRAGC